MSALKASRTAQWPLVAEFTWNFNDTAIDTVSVTSKTFGSTHTDTLVFDCINLPANAIVIGGDVTTETAATGSTAYNVSVGDSGSTTRYLGATDKTTAARTALVPTGYVGTGENIRITVAATVADATAGKFTLRVEYVIRNRSNEVQAT